MQNNSGFIKLSLTNVKCLVRSCSIPMTNKLIKLFLFLFCVDLNIVKQKRESKKQKFKGKVYNFLNNECSKFSSCLNLITQLCWVINVQVSWILTCMWGRLCTQDTASRPSSVGWQWCPDRPHGNAGHMYSRRADQASLQNRHTPDSSPHLSL